MTTEVFAVLAQLTLFAALVGTIAGALLAVVDVAIAYFTRGDKP